MTRLISASFMTSQHQRSHVLLAAGVLCATTACRTWRSAGSVGGDASTSARLVAAASGPDAQPVRLTTQSGAVVVLLTPRVERDSVVGTEARDRARRAVALADVHHVETYRIGVAATAGAVTAGVLVTLGALFLLAGYLVSRGT